MDENENGSFDRRLSAAQAKRPKAPGPAAGSASAWGIGARVGVELLSALVVGLGLGWALDRWLGTGPILLALGVVLGGAAGVANVWRLMAPRK